MQIQDCGPVISQSANRGLFANVECRKQKVKPYRTWASFFPPPQFLPGPPLVLFLIPFLLFSPPPFPYPLLPSLSSPSLLFLPLLPSVTTSSSQSPLPSSSHHLLLSPFSFSIMRVTTAASSLY